MYTESMKYTSRVMGPWRHRHIDLLYITLTYCLSEGIGSAVHFWNSPTKKPAVKWKTKKADFLPWKAEKPPSCSGKQGQCPWPSLSLGVGNSHGERGHNPQGQWEQQGSARSHALDHAGSCSTEGSGAAPRAGPNLPSTAEDPPQRRFLAVDTSFRAKHKKAGK